MGCDSFSHEETYSGTITGLVSSKDWSETFTTIYFDDKPGILIVGTPSFELGERYEIVVSRHHLISMKRLEEQISSRS